MLRVESYKLNVESSIKPKAFPSEGLAATLWLWFVPGSKFHVKRGEGEWAAKYWLKVECLKLKVKPN